ncbi:MAG: HAD-IB family hydrolase [Hyphomicrobiales bacterium]|nr:HAD-IB family hydrolase [Hyphomicrobiales bacterium]
MRDVVVFDLDGTLTRKDTYLGFLAAVLRERPWRAFGCLHLPICFALFRAGLVSNSWLKASFLKAVAGGLTRDDLAKTAELFAGTVVSGYLRRGARERLARHREAGARIVIATASLDVYVPQIAARLGVSSADMICTRTHWTGKDTLSGALDGDNCYGEAKVEAVRGWLAANGLTGVAAAYSDHHSDLPLLAMADKPVAVNPTPGLRRLAQDHGIPVEDWSGNAAVEETAPDGVV